MSTNLRMALRALTQNKMQALLTLLGMSVGIAMVVIVSGLGRGAQLKIESQIEAAGPTRITIRAGNFTPSAIDSGGQQDSSGGEPSEGSFAAGLNTGGEMADASHDSAVMDARRRMRAVQRTRYRSPPAPLGTGEVARLRQVDGVRAVSGRVEGNVSLGAGLPVHVARFSGFESGWPDMTDWKLTDGRWISAAEHQSAAPVMLVTRRVAGQFWPAQSSPVGQTISVGGRAITVVGVIDTGTEDAGETVVPTVFVPLGLAQTLTGRTSYDAITVRTVSVGVTAMVAKAVREKLRGLHHLPSDMVDDFRVETQSVAAMPGMGSDPRLARAVHSNTAGFEQASWEQMAKSLRQAGRTFTLLLAGAAAVSLLVGGIGIMNIMLVSVAARTREIGLRMALGARAGDVMLQFLVEAVTLAALGGVVGLLLGLGGLLVTQYGLHWAAAVSPAMLAVAFAMAAITGVVFGLVPARRAAFLDPVIALRSE